jgi:hypothetical protein
VEWRWSWRIASGIVGLLFRFTIRRLRRLTELNRRGYLASRTLPGNSLRYSIARAGPVSVVNRSTPQFEDTGPGGTVHDDCFASGLPVIKQR